MYWVDQLDILYLRVKNQHFPFFLVALYLWLLSYDTFQLNE